MLRASDASVMSEADIMRAGQNGRPLQGLEQQIILCDFLAVSACLALEFEAYKQHAKVINLANQYIIEEFTMYRKIVIPSGKMADHSCRHCGGSGMMKCPRCDGTGTFHDGSTCYYCNGAKEVTCNACGGTGIIRD